MHYPNGEMEESTESRLYHMIITIDDNTHSGGVSLQQTKERKYQLFFLKLGLSLK